jgi:hypothetical protein
MKARPAFCLEEPDPGLCRAYFEVYHYNSTTDACQMFVYGGCDGNANRFRSISQCERDCFAGVLSGVQDADEEEHGEEGSVDNNTVVDEEKGAKKIDDGHTDAPADVKAAGAEGVKVEEGSKVRRSA